jgi:hypothetical protein
VFRDERPVAEGKRAGHLTDFRQDLRVLSNLPATMGPGEILVLPVELRNPTAALWHAYGQVPHPVNVAFLPRSLAAGESIRLGVVVRAPEVPRAEVRRPAFEDEAVAPAASREEDWS